MQAAGLFRRSLLVVAVVLPARGAGWSTCPPASADELATTSPGRGEFEQSVVDLGSRDYRLRVAATRRLRNAAGGDALAAVVESAEWSDPEVAARCLRILRFHADSEDEPVRLRAQAALESLSRSSDARLAARARRHLTEARRGLLTLIENAGGTVEFADTKGERIAGIHLQRCPHAGDLLRRLKGLQTLERLNLASCELTDDSLKRLPELGRLKYLCLQSNPITDAGLEHVARLDGVEALYLSSTKISDRGVETLRRHAELKVLWLNYTAVGDGSIDTLSELRQLKHLRITGTRITPAGLERLERALPETRVTR
ncbi:MAG TPA: hypothetical protein VML55_22455 [Planctomycetaceae bacterium]|nr:hypothetical protein [Planctomycetaceae bacterium]